LARAGAPEPTWTVRESRIKAEHLRLFGANVRYDGSGVAGVLDAITGSSRAAARSAWSGVSIDATQAASEFAVELANFSFAAGAPPSPVALTTWRQPWVPLYVEWRVHLTGTDKLDGWTLDGLDLSADPEPAATIDTTFTGRSPITVGI